MKFTELRKAGDKKFFRSTTFEASGRLYGLSTSMGAKKGRSQRRNSPCRAARRRPQRLPPSELPEARRGPGGLEAGGRALGHGAPPRQPLLPPEREAPAGSSPRSMQRRRWEADRRFVPAKATATEKLKGDGATAAAGGRPQIHPGQGDDNGETEGRQSSGKTAGGEACRWRGRRSSGRRPGRIGHGADTGWGWGGSGGGFGSEGSDRIFTLDLRGRVYLLVRKAEE